MIGHGMPFDDLNTFDSRPLLDRIDYDLSLDAVKVFPGVLVGIQRTWYLQSRKVHQCLNVLNIKTIPQIPPWARDEPESTAFYIIGRFRGTTR